MWRGRPMAAGWPAAAWRRGARWPCCAASGPMAWSTPRSGTAVPGGARPPVRPPSVFDVTAIGEVMLRLSVPMGHRLETAGSLDLHPGGAEANVLGALARLGRHCAWVGSLPSHALGRLVANHLRSQGI